MSTIINHEHIGWFACGQTSAKKSFVRTMTTFTTSSPCVYVSARSMLLMHVSRRRSVHCLLVNTVGERSNWIRVKLKNVHVLDKVLRNENQLL